MDNHCQCERISYSLVLFVSYQRILVQEQNSATLSSAVSYLNISSWSPQLEPLVEDTAGTVVCGRGLINLINIYTLTVCRGIIEEFAACYIIHYKVILHVS